MKRSTIIALTCTSVFALAVLSINAGCQSSDDPVPASNPGGAGGGTGGTAGGGTAGTAGGGTAGTAGGGTGGTAGGGSDGGYTCTATDGTATVKDIAEGTTPTGKYVEFDGAAISQKILVSLSKSSGSCLWGTFVKDLNADRGIQVVFYGPDAVKADDGTLSCPVDTAGIPVDLKVGDLVHVMGKTGAYPVGKVNDAGVAIQPQVQVTACAFKVTGNDPSKAQPVVVTTLADLAAGKKELAGMLVRVENVTPLANGDAGGVVGSYGIIKLDGVEVHDKFYYKNAATDAIKGGAPVFAAGTVFKSITGINHLDYDVWCIQPRDKCVDFDPKSTDCTP